MADSGKLMLFSMAMDEENKTEEKQATDVKNANTEETKDENIDTELDDLLDSALEDFSHPPPTSATSNEATEGAQSGPSLPELGQAQGTQHASKPEPGGGGDVHQFEEVMRELLGDDADLAAQFEQLASMAGNMDDSEGNQKAFSDTLQQTLNSLAENTDNLEGDVSDDELVRALAGLGLGGGEGLGGDDGMLGAMQGMMKSLISKDVLYPALKEMTNKYPDWLSENKSVISSEEYTKFERQYHLMKTVCTCFEEENDSEPDDVKQQRFERILDTMQQMQSCGNPPESLMKEMGSPELPPGFGMGDPSQMPPAPDQCCVM